VVGVEPEPELVDVELPAALDVRDRDDDDFALPVHADLLTVSGPWCPWSA